MDREVLLGWAAHARSMLNDNQGVLAVLLFVATLVLGWASGIFSALMRKPKIRIDLIPGPSFVCTFGIGESYKDYELHRTCIALYVRATNIGSAATSIEEVHVGYHWAVLPLTRAWWRYGVAGRYWITHQAVALADFQVLVGDHVKFFPFLVQHSSMSGVSAQTFLEPGRTTNGVVYFEQASSYGACFPRAKKMRVKLRVRIIDSYGRSYWKIATVPRVKLDQARVYNPKFGETLKQLHGGTEAFDLETDRDGNLVNKTETRSHTTA